MSIKAAFALTWEEQLDFLAKLESRAKNPKVVPISKALVEIFTPAPTIDIKSELKSLGDALTHEIEALASKIPKEIVGKDGKQGIQGKTGDIGVGKQGIDGKQGVAGIGVQGKQGTSITGVRVDFDNSLIVTLSDGTEIDAGQIEVKSDSSQVIATVRGTDAVSNYKVLAVSTNYTVIDLVGTTVYLVNASSANVIITLPIATNVTATYNIKKIDASVNTVTVNSAISTIDGGNSSVIKVQYASITLASNLVDYFII